MPADQTCDLSLARAERPRCAQVASGQYQNASEVVRAGLRLLIQQAQQRSGQRRRARKGSRAPGL